MPIEVGIGRLGPKPERVQMSALDSELMLENALVADLSILSPQLMLIGRQVPTSYGKFIDILAMDPSGDLLIIELKRNRTPREVIAQLLDYASWAQSLSYEEIGSYQCRILSLFRDGGQGYLTRTWLINPDEVEQKASKSKAKKGSEPRNGRDFT
jgi:hypothetical protein